MSFTEISQDEESIFFVGMQKGNGEWYLFLFDKTGREPVIRRLGELADNPDLSFTWQDAKKVTELIREETP